MRLLGDHVAADLLGADGVELHGQKPPLRLDDRDPLTGSGPERGREVARVGAFNADQVAIASCKEVRQGPP